jgi:CelD/BcsL family acetyltransferase involved in cellulose biosynthesis
LPLATSQSSDRRATVCQKSIHRTLVYHTLDDLEKLRPDWEDLLAEFSGATTFSTWEWLAPWWRAFGRGRELRVLAFFDASAKLVGLAPLAISQRRVAHFFKLRVVTLMGDGSGDSDNLDFPVRAGWEESVAAALLAFLKEESKQWDFCEFNTMPSDSPVSGSLAKLLAEYGWTTYEDQRVCSAICLPETWEGYLKQISSKERGKIAYYHNRLTKKYRVRFYRCDEETEISTCLETLFNLHRRRWQLLGQPGSFESAPRRQFYHEMARLLLATNKLEFWLLELDGQPVAAQFGFRHGQTVFQLQEGFDPAYFADSVGYILRAHGMEQLISRGVRRYDFLAGESASKTRWASQAGHYLNAEFARAFSAGSAYLFLIHRASEAKEWLRSRLHSNAWRFLHALNQKFRGFASAKEFAVVSATAVQPKIAIRNHFSRSDPAAEAK